MQTPDEREPGMRSGMKPAVASIVLALMWAVGSDPMVRSALPPGPATARADAGARPPAAESVRLGDEAVTRGDYAAADALYRVALAAPEHRASASGRLHALHDLNQFTLPVDDEGVSELQGWLGHRFSRYETEHFVVLSDAGRQAALSRGRTMERARHQYFRVMGRLGAPVVPPKHKLLCVYFDNHSDYTRFANDRDNVDTGWIAGYYTGVGNRVVFYNDATSPRFTQARDAIGEYESTLAQARERMTDARRGRDLASAEQLAAYTEDLQARIREENERLDEEADRVAESKTIHETVHLLAFNTGLQSRARLYPFWFTEGLASSFETENPRSSFGPDRPTPRRVAEYADAIADGRAIPLAALVRMTEAGHGHSHARAAEALYAQAHALFVYLYKHEREAMVSYVDALLSESPGQISGERHAALFEAAFGDPAALERRLRRNASR